VVKLLPVLDAFDLARAHLGEGDELSPEEKALLQAAALLADTLAKEGLERIDDVGAEFDPMVHDAVEHTAASADTGHASQTGPVVHDVLRSGYRWKGRVIRPAMVRVQG
jgi:molecular chaperone GrpE